MSRTLIHRMKAKFKEGGELPTKLLLHYRRSNKEVKYFNPRYIKLKIKELDKNENKEN